MPALPFASNIIKMGFRHGLGVDTDAFVKLLLAFAGTSTTGDLTSLAVQAAISWDAWLAPIAPEQVTLEEVTCTDLSSDTSPEGSATDGTAGALSGGLSGSACVVISDEIARRYRGGHPRQYWPFGSESKLGSAQTWDPTFVGDVVTAFAGFLADIEDNMPTGLTFTNWANVSYFKGFENHTYPSGRTRAVPTVRSSVVIDPVTAFTVRSSIGSQRRRNQFVG